METKKQTKDFVFKPTKELIEFADFFSNNWKNLSVGTYKSKKDKYTIKFEDKILDKHSKKEYSTNIRVGLSSGIIEVSKSKLLALESNPDYVFFMVLWCAVEYNLKSNIQSDIITLKYYLKTGRSVKNIMLGYTSLFKRVPYTGNVIRMQKIMDYIEEFETKKIK